MLIVFISSSCSGSAECRDAVGEVGFGGGLICFTGALMFSFGSGCFVVGYGNFDTDSERREDWLPFWLFRPAAFSLPFLLLGPVPFAT